MDVVLVTGAAGGIGSAIARKLAQGGFTVALTDHTRRVEAVAAQLAADGGIAASWVTELTRPEQLAELVRSVSAKYGRIDSGAGAGPFLRRAGS